MAKIVSLVIWFSYLITGYIFGERETLFIVLGSLSLPLGAIWFGNELGDWSGRIWFRPLTSSPGYLIRFMGWVLLLLPAILLSILYFIL